MTVGLSTTLASTVLSDLNGSWLQLHVGDPGAAGTANPAVESDRKQVTISAPGAAATNTNVLSWPSVAAGEDPTHYSLWSASSGGTFLFSGTITTAPYSAGDTFEIAAGDLDITVTTVAA